MVGGSGRDAVTLQVNVAPSDLPHAGATLRHQLRQWGNQVAGVNYTLDLHRSAGPRGARFEERRPPMQRLIADLAAEVGGARVCEVDYGDEQMRRVADLFFGGVVPPAKDCYGAPFYAYFYGLASVDTRYVLHMDCDILFGGGSGSWISEAADLLRGRPEVLFVTPLAGPPTPNGRLPRRVRRRQQTTQLWGSQPALESLAPRAYRLEHVSSRVFFADLERLRAVGPIEILDAPAWSYGSDLATSPFLPAETSLSLLMRERRGLRIDYLGADPGMWFIHPGQRGPDFTANLANLIAAIECGAVPARQVGSGALIDEWIDGVGPARFRPPRHPVNVGTAVRWLGRASGARAVRAALQHGRWHYGRRKRRNGR